jgi:hypothetical protein
MRTQPTLFGVSLAFLLSLSACGDDSSRAGDAGAGDGSAGDGGSGEDGGQPDASMTDAGSSEDGGGTDGGSDGGTVRRRSGHVAVGHVGGSELRIYQFDVETMEATMGSPWTAPSAYDDVEGLPGIGVAVPLPAEDELVILDGETLTEAEGSPYATAEQPAEVAYDPVRQRLYVYGIVSGPGTDTLTVFDTSMTPFEEVSGSPFDFDAVATHMEVDPSSGRLFGISTTTVWAADVDESGVTFIGDSPLSVTSPSALAVDGEAGVAYYAKGFPSQIVARNTASFEELSQSPLSIGGMPPYDLALVPDLGDLFLLDGVTLGAGRDASLQYVTGSPLEVQTTCDNEDGCVLDSVETGVGYDAVTERLFVAVTGTMAEGELSVWDVADPTSPSELSDMRAPVGPGPAWVTVY